MATAAFSDSRDSTAGAAVDLCARRFQTAGLSVSDDRYSFLVDYAYVPAYFRHDHRGALGPG
jgi:hypothetical protein